MISSTLMQAQSTRVSSASPYFFHTGASSHSDAYFGEGSGMIHLTFVNCSGSEYDIGECETKSVGISSSHSLDVGVKCLPGIIYYIYAHYYFISCVLFYVQHIKLTEREIFV